MGSLSRAAFVDLRELLVGRGHDELLDELAELDIESTTFETRFRALQSLVLAELDPVGE